MPDRIHLRELSDEQLASAAASVLTELLERRQRDEMSLDLDMLEAPALFVTVARGAAAESLKAEVEAGASMLLRAIDQVAH